MNSTFWKNIIREIKNSLGRFLAIFAIVAIGVAFFAGVTAASTDMQNSADKYYDDYNFMDLRLVSTAGFTKDDVDSIKETNGLSGVFATHTVDALTEANNTEEVVKVMTVPDSGVSQDNPEYINQLRIKEGRLPKNDDECVVRWELSKENIYNIGDTISLKSGDDNELSDTLSIQEFKVVGIVYSPYFLSYNKGTTSIGNGSVGYCIMVKNNIFCEQYYTEIFATVDGAKALDTYSDEYKNKVAPVKEELKNLATSRLDIRKADIDSELDSAKDEAIQQAYDKIKEQVTEQFTDTYGHVQGMTAIMDAMLNEAVQNAISVFDSSQIDEYFEQLRAEYKEQSDDWKWYVLDRDEQYSYVDYKSSAEQMTNIAAIFPVFFIIVAALVCLTTMTRMVDEQRELIGTFKALGYSKSVIALKYIGYAFIASLTGGIAGCAIGLKLFPAVIYNSWNIMYEMPAIAYADHTVLAIVAIASLVFVTCLASFFACLNELREVPAQLMRPKAPKEGKKILLERITFIWQRMSFARKVTARNIFRYKKRFIMTVVGIAGCSALMLTGYGIKDSISGLIDGQFGRIFSYDISISYSEKNQDNEDGTIADLENMLNSDNRFGQVIQMYTHTSNVSKQEFQGGLDSQEIDSDIIQDNVKLQVFDGQLPYADFVGMYQYKSNELIGLDDDGIIISQLLADNLGVKAGDDIYIEDDNKNVKKAHISNVMKMYVGDYIFMSSTYYEDIYGNMPDNNCIIGKLNNKGTDTENSIGLDYLNRHGVSNITFFTDSINRFTKMIQSLDIVTLVLILSSASLAFVVLYNLTNVNISERIREIATIKVLGFYDMEVSMYVYRENIIITVIGAFAGLFLGVGLHRFIMYNISVDGVMFGTDINLSSYFLAFGLTLFFSVFVNLVMNGKLKKIAMVESLKSVE